MNHHHHHPIEKPAKCRRFISYTVGAAVFGLVGVLFSVAIIDLVDNWKMHDWPYVRGNAGRSQLYAGEAEPRALVLVSIIGPTISSAMPRTDMFTTFMNRSSLKISGSDRVLGVPQSNWHQEDGSRKSQQSE